MHEPDSTQRRDRLRKTWLGTSAAVILGALIVSLLISKPAIPDRITLLTGPEGSAYHSLGVKYAEYLRRRGLDTEVVVTAGALDNLQRLAAGENAIAFAPSTADHWDDSGIDFSHLVALGSVGVEPLWLFSRADIDIARVPDLAGTTIATGGPGTVSHYVAGKLIERNKLSDEVELQNKSALPLEALIENLLTGGIDAIFTTGAPRSPLVETLLDADGVSFLSFDRAEAYAALIPGVTELVVPEGLIDLARNVPPQDAHLLAAASCLVAHQDLHPAVAPMILLAAESAGESSPGLSRKITFPSDQYLTLPLDPAARRYFSQGEVGLSKFLPYKVTRFLNHLGFFVLPLLTVVIVLLRVVPAGLRIWVSIQLKRFFRELESVEKRRAAGAERSELLADLERIDKASATIFVPRSAAQDYVDFRQFLHDMRERVKG